MCSPIPTQKEGKSTDAHHSTLVVPSMTPLVLRARGITSFQRWYIRGSFSRTGAERGLGDFTISVGEVSIRLINTSL